jgi:uridylate kinase
MEKIVISIGGSVLLAEDVDFTFLENLGNLLEELSIKYKLFVITGGGKLARIYIRLGRELKLDEKTLDELGIETTRINAKLLANVVKVANIKIPISTEEAIGIDKSIVIMGGTTPGHSTDMVGAELAEKIKADRFIIATNVDGIYNKDPNKYNDAKQLKKVTIKDLIEEYGTKWNAAGKNIVVDGPALEIIQRAKINTFVVNGKRLDQLEKAITNEKFDGTKILI